MDHASDGYVTELAYSVNHFPEMAPAHLNLALLHLGLMAPDIAQPFNYLELGFGQGLGLNLLAATYPQGRFFGNDFMPAHVEAAQHLATQAGLGNLHLFEDSFAQLQTRDLPRMDYIVLHGVYSWVSAESRAHIVALITKLLAPEGVVYISYNSLPGWAVKAPMQRLMSEFAQRQAHGTALQRFHAARDLLASLSEADAAFFRSNPPARAMLAEITQASDAYLLHEFAPQGWTPFYHTDVAQDLAAAALTFAGSAKLFNIFPEYSLPAKSRALLAATPDAGLRELLRDFAVHTPFRRDIFVRGARSRRVDEGDQHYALLRPLASCALRCQTPIGERDLEAALYEPLLQSLSQAPQRLASLMSLPSLVNFSPASRTAAMTMLLCLGYVGVASSLASTDKARVRDLNRALLTRLRAGERISGLASAALGSAIEISYHDLLFLTAQQAGATSAEDLARFAQGILAPAGAADEAWQARCYEARNFLHYGNDFYCGLDLF